MVHLLYNYTFSVDSTYCSNYSWKTYRKTCMMTIMLPAIYLQIIHDEATTEFNKLVLLKQTSSTNTDVTVKGQQHSPHPTTKRLSGVMKYQPLS